MVNPNYSEKKASLTHGYQKRQLEETNNSPQSDHDPVTLLESHNTPILQGHCTGDVLVNYHKRQHT